LAVVQVEEVILAQTPCPVRPFDKNLLFDGKSLWEKKDPVKEKNRAKGREIREASEEKGTMQAGTLPIEGDKGKKEADYQNLDQLFPLPPELPLNGGVICGNLKILIRGILIESKLGVRLAFDDITACKCRSI